MATIETVYLGELRTSAKHVQSGKELITDAPVDNQGKGEAFSPTDLLSAALTSCMLTIMGIAARTHGIALEGTRVETTKIMQANPRKVAEIVVDFHFPASLQLEEKQRKLLSKAAETCPVYLSLDPAIKKTIHYNW
ncbi:OsmC family protein [Olivibacter sitiensis]|uniref:OsmC family protein n=1 Tax=Olivibacter sitiensis TaxID=376470 RepID=UPI000489B746|nr:OsmC family protein [Olivibacter sitiensis]